MYLYIYIGEAALNPENLSTTKAAALKFLETEAPSRFLWRSFAENINTTPLRVLSPSHCAAAPSACFCCLHCSRPTPLFGHSRSSPANEILFM